MFFLWQEQWIRDVVDVLWYIFWFRDCICGACVGPTNCVLRGRHNPDCLAWVSCIFRVRATFHALLAVYRCEMIAGAAFCDIYIYMPVLRRESMVKSRYANICIYVYVNMSIYIYKYIYIYICIQVRKNV